MRTKWRCWNGVDLRPISELFCTFTNRCVLFQTLVPFYKIYNTSVVLLRYNHLFTLLRYSVVPYFSLIIYLSQHNWMTVSVSLFYSSFFPCPTRTTFHDWTPIAVFCSLYEIVFGRLFLHRPFFCLSSNPSTVGATLRSSRSVEEKNTFVLSFACFFCFLIVCRIESESRQGVPRLNASTRRC